MIARGALFALSVLACGIGSMRALAEGEASHPAFNGTFYRRWVMAGSMESDSRLECRYLGSSADRDASYRIRLRVLSRSYRKSARGSKPLVSVACPATPEAQGTTWVPGFLDRKAAGRLGLQAESAGVKDEAITLDLSARGLDDASGLCDDEKRSLGGYFSGRKNEHAGYCRQLAAREFDRGLRRCLSLADRGLNRLHMPGFKRDRMEAVVRRPGEPTQAYCESLLKLGGPRFDAEVLGSYACDTPFEALLLQPPPHRDEVLRAVFGRTAERVLPPLEKVNRDCRESEAKRR